VLDAGLQRATQIAEQGLNVFEHPQSAGGGPIWRWRDLLRIAGLSFSPIQEYLQHVLEEEPARLPALLGFFAGWSDDRPSFRHSGFDRIREGAREIFGWCALLRAVVRYRRGEYAPDPTAEHLVRSLEVWLQREADRHRRERRRPAVE
jgi:hypothetical protein